MKKTSDKSNTASARTSERKQKIMTAIVTCASFSILLGLVMLVGFGQTRPRTEPITISVVNATDEECKNAGGGKKDCSGSISIDANLTDEGVIPQREIDIEYSPANSSLSEDAAILQKVIIPENEYASLKDAEAYEAIKKFTLFKENGSSREIATYELSIVYNFTEKDQRMLSNLDKAYQGRLDEARAKQEAEAKQREKERIEREQAENQKRQQEEYEKEVKSTTHILCKRALDEYYYPSKATIGLLDTPYVDKLIDDRYYYYFKAKIKSSAGATVYQDVGCITQVDGDNVKVVDFWEEHYNVNWGK